MVIQQLCLMVWAPSHHSLPREGLAAPEGRLEDLHFAGSFDFQCGGVEQKELHSFGSGRIHGLGESLPLLDSVAAVIG